MKIILVLLMVGLSSCLPREEFKEEFKNVSEAPQTSMSMLGGRLSTFEDTKRGVVCYVLLNRHDDSLSCVKVK